MMTERFGSFPESRKIGTLAFDGMHLREGAEFSGSSLFIEGYGSDEQTPSHAVMAYDMQKAAGILELKPFVHEATKR